jgi:hypothetical protein
VWRLSIALLLLACEAPVVDAIEGGPRAPELTPCPVGWSEVRTGSAVACAPWSPDEEVQCEPGFARFAGDPRCARVGTECPSGEYPVGVSGDPVLYVSASAAPGGDGSIDAPFTRITEALAAARVAGTTIAVGKGIYEGPIEIPGGVMVWGACPEETIVRAEFPVVVLAAGSVAGLHNITVRGRAAGIWAQDALIAITNVVVEDATTVGVLISGAVTGELRDVVVRETMPDAPRTGIGIAIEDGSTVNIRRAVIDANHAEGIAVSGESTLTASDVVVTRTMPAFDGSLGRALEVRSGAHAEIERAWFHDNTRGVFVDEASLVLTDTAIVGGERGISVQSGGEVRASRVWIERASDGGIVVIGGTFEGDDVIVRATAPRPDGTFGRGIGVAGAVTLRRAIVEDNHEIGVFVDGEGARFVATDLRVAGTRSLPVIGTGGRGIGVQHGAEAEIDRAWIVDNREAGVLAHLGASITLFDVLIARTLGAECEATTCPDFAFGDGALVAFGARATFDHFIVADNARVGVAIGPESSVDLTDGQITRNVIGASVQVDGYDVRRIQESVVYTENERNLDRGALPLAEPSASF